jgi:enoyl-CoA hydratase/carnithine racemase
MQMPALPNGLTLERAGAHATVTLARADGRNALSAEIMRGLRDVALWLKTDIETHVVVLNGAPVFSAGADLKDPDMRTDHLDKLSQRRLCCWGRICARHGKRWNR